MKIKIVLMIALFPTLLLGQNLSPVEQHLLYNKVHFNLEMGKPVSKKNLIAVLNSNVVSFLSLRDMGYELYPTKYKPIAIQMLKKCSAFGIFQEKKLKSLLDSNDYNTVLNCYLDSITPEDIKIANEAIERQAVDKYLRLTFPAKRWKKKNAIKVAKHRELIAKDDSINYHEFIAKLLKEGKFPKRHIFNLSLGEPTFVLFLHDVSAFIGNDTVKFEKYRKKIYQMVLDGKFSPYDYAFWVDRHYIMYFQKNNPIKKDLEMYGTYRWVKTKPDEIQPVYDPKNLNKRRQSIGIRTTEQEITLRLYRLKQEKAKKEKTK